MIKMVEQEKRYMILFGDGHICYYWSKELKRNEEGLLEWVFIILPSNEIQKTYNFGEELDKQGYIIRRYLKEYIFDIGGFDVLCTVDVNGNSTALSRTDEVMINKIQNQQKEINYLKLRQSVIHDDINDLLNQPFKKTDDDVERFMTVLKLRKRKGDEEVEYQQEVE